jgi:hypothetical protein
MTESQVTPKQSLSLQPPQNVSNEPRDVVGSNGQVNRLGNIHIYVNQLKFLTVSVERISKLPNSLVPLQTCV